MVTAKTESKDSVMGRHKAWHAQNPLRKWRNAQSTKVSVRVMASMLGVNPGSINNWEVGASQPQGEAFTKMFQVTDGAVTRKAWDDWTQNQPKA